MMQEFVDRTPAEKAGSNGAKYKIWAFSGIVEYAKNENSIYGWAFFDMVKDIEGGQIGNYEYTSIARVTVNTSSNPPQINTTRMQNDKGLFGVSHYVRIYPRIRSSISESELYSVFNCTSDSQYPNSTSTLHS